MRLHRIRIVGAILVVCVSLPACGSTTGRSVVTTVPPKATAYGPNDKASPVTFGTFNGSEAVTLGNGSTLLRVDQIDVTSTITAIDYRPASFDHTKLSISPVTYAKASRPSYEGGDFDGTVPPTSMAGTTLNPRSLLGWVTRKPLSGATLSPGSYYLFEIVKVKKPSAIVKNWTLAWRSSTTRASASQNITYRLLAPAVVATAARRDMQSWIASGYKEMSETTPGNNLYEATYGTDPPYGSYGFCEAAIVPGSVVYAVVGEKNGARVTASGSAAVPAKKDPADVSDSRCQHAWESAH